MALSRAKYRRLPDLYVAGKEVVLKDNSVIWLQVLNPLQADEARHDAQVARSRLVMALNIHGGDEMAFVETALWQDGVDVARARVAESKGSGTVVKVIEELRNDVDWTERLEIMNRDEADSPREDAEKALLIQIQQDYVLEVQRRIAAEDSYLKEQYKDADEQTLKQEYARLYIDRRGGEMAAVEYRTVEVWYGARVCEGTRSDAGEWSHEACEGHVVQVFETKADVRQLPEDLGELLGQAYDALAMSLRDAKDLARLASSSDSSRQPNAEAESTLSTPAETPDSVPGTSPQPSLTPSPS